MSRIVIPAAFALLSLGLLSAAPATANRVVIQPEGSYELRLAGVVLPGSTAGYVVFKPCADCDATSMRVSSATGYAVDGASVSFADFLLAAEEIRGTAGGERTTAVYVFYDVESRRVNRLVLDRLGG